MFGAEEGAAEILVEAKDHLLQGLADDNRELKYSAFYHLPLRLVFDVYFAFFCFDPVFNLLTYQVKAENVLGR